MPYFLWSAFLLLYFLGALPQTCNAQGGTVQSGVWKVPDGTLSDLSQTFTAGTTLAVSWNKYESTQYIDTTRNLVYLWVSSFDYSNNPFSQLLKTNINMTQPGNFPWTIAVPSNVLAISAKYVLRFKLPDSTFDTGSGELSSPGFIVLRPDVVATTSTSSTSTSATSSIPQATSTILLPPTSATSILSETSNISAPVIRGMSAGAEAGIGVGVGIVALTVIALIAWVLLRRRSRTAARTANAGDSATYPPAYDKTVGYPDAVPVELPSGDRGNIAELYGHTR